MNPNTSDIFDHSGLDERAKAYLLETSRWTKFLAIIGFIAIGFLVFFAIVAIGVGGMNSMAYAFGEWGAFLYFIIMAGMYLYPALALINFSRLIKSGIHRSSQEDITEAFRHQKNLYKYMGILVIICLILILVSMIAGGVMVAMYRP